MLTLKVGASFIYKRTNMLSSFAQLLALKMKKKKTDLKIHSALIKHNQTFLIPDMHLRRFFNTSFRCIVVYVVQKVDNNKGDIRVVPPALGITRSDTNLGHKLWNRRLRLSCEENEVQSSIIKGRRNEKCV